MWTPARSVVAASVLPLVLAVTGCTGGGDTEGEAAPSPTPTATATATESAPRLRERAAPYRVRYRAVAGTVPKGKREQYLRSLARPVKAWIDGGFVDGPWPRKGFGRAFAPFGRYITQKARKDGDVLTLRSATGSLVDVVPQRRRIGLSVTMMRGGVVGASAHVDLRVLGVDRDERRHRVRVRGDLYLTRVKGHGWKIFGYEVDRWTEPGRGGRTAGAGQGGGG